MTRVAVVLRVWYTGTMPNRPDIDLKLTRRNIKVEVLMTPEAKKRAKIAAALDGDKNLSEFVRAAVRERARRILSAHGLD